ncbi:MAG TPA: RNA polymerase sigma-70 factor [Cytophagales bacterium]|nr:RNA polymerase sigma-70 factor [Cytophagales bacterium]
MYSDKDLIAGLKQGDEHVFDLIFKKYWKLLYKQAFYKLQSKELAEEIVQDLFLNLWEKRSVLKINTLENYLFVSLRNRCIDQIRTQISHQKHWDFYKKYIPKSIENTQDTIVCNDLKRKLEEGLQLLPEKSRRVFQLSRMEGKSVAEIAKTLSLSEKAIEYYITKSLKTLKVYLKDFVLVIFASFFI